MREPFKQSLLPCAMSRTIRVLLLDLLVERSEFGHGGNQEVIHPIAEFGNVDVFLLTPQMQSLESGGKAADEGLFFLDRSDVPKWDDEYEFWRSCKVTMGGNLATFSRIALPFGLDDAGMSQWLCNLGVDAVVCSGSRRNVTMWEEWMESAASLMRVAATSGSPTLGICFGHQLLCKSLGSEVTRAEKMSSGIWEMVLNEDGMSDELFESRWQSGRGPEVVYSHQDHVITIPENCILLGSAEHNPITAVRVVDSHQRKMPAWGVQFHPEAARHRIQRAFEWGHITEAEMLSFQKDHDGAGVLEAFADVVQRHMS